jgi:hypothetical protein
MEKTFEIKGLRELTQKLQQAGLKVRPALRQALYECAEEVRGKALRVTPKDTGTLRNSVKNYGVKGSGAVLVATIGAGGPAIPYALAVHEHPSGHSPRSWRGKKKHKKIHWTLPGTGPKYLERPAKAYPLGRELKNKLRNSIELAMKKAR